jgi:phosphoribosyl 1,2-cyclic phosphate phosphodiesterase
MRLTVLGSGGNSPTPMPTCQCRVCVEARERGVPYARRGNALYVHDVAALVDCPELVWETLNREGIVDVEYVFLTHFHADHTLGLRVLQALGGEDPPLTDFVGDVPTLVLSEATHRRAVEGNEVLAHLVDAWADVRLLADGETMDLGDTRVTHHSAPIEPDGPDAISGFCFEDGDATVFLSPDENRHFDLDRLPALDCWVKETGYFRETPAGDTLVTNEAEHNAIAHEMTFEESLDQVRAVEADHVVMTEIEELYRRSYDDYRALEVEYEHLGVEFAYDGLELDV